VADLFVYRIDELLLRRTNRQAFQVATDYTLHSVVCDEIMIMWNKNVKLY